MTTALHQEVERQKYGAPEAGFCYPCRQYLATRSPDRRWGPTTGAAASLVATLNGISKGWGHLEFSDPVYSDVESIFWNILNNSPIFNSFKSPFLVFIMIINNLPKNTHFWHSLWTLTKHPVSSEIQTTNVLVVPCLECSLSGVVAASYLCSVISWFLDCYLLLGHSFNQLTHTEHDTVNAEMI